MTKEELLTVKDAMRVLRLSRLSIYRAILQEAQGAQGGRREALEDPAR